jgi:iron complex outermembrane receptor protein
MAIRTRGSHFKRTLALLFCTSMLAGVDQARAEAAADNADAAVSTGALEEVTVYARKRAEDVQEVPVPVTSMTALQIQRQNLVSFTTPTTAW